MKNKLKDFYFEKEYIITKKEAPQPVIINQPPQQNQGQNNELLEKFLNLAERFTNLEEKIYAFNFSFIYFCRKFVTVFMYIIICSLNLLIK